MPVFPRSADSQGAQMVRKLGGVLTMAWLILLILVLLIIVELWHRFGSDDDEGRGLYD